MAIKISGTTVIDDSRTLQNVIGLKTVGGQSILGSGDIDAGGGITFSRKTANYTAAAGEGIIADTSGGGFIVTLPATPATGDQVVVADGANWATNNLTVGRNGSTIEGAAEDLILDIGSGQVSFVYDGTTWEVYTQLGIGSDGTYLRNPIIEGSFTEDVFTITDGASVDINPANGTIQLWTLTANRTPTASSFGSGQQLTLMIDDGSGFAVIWTTIGVVWVGGNAPTLSTTGRTVIQLWKVASTVYGVLVGSVA